MNKRTKFLAQVAFYILAGALMAYAASRTLDFVNQTMPPDKKYMGYLFLFSTGIGALIWLLVLLTYADGAKQRGIAFGMGIVDLIGELTLVYADTVLVASENGTLQMSTDELRIFVLASVGIMGINLVAAYFFKLFDPKAEATAKARDLTDEVTDATMAELNTPEAKQQMIAELSPILRKRVLDQVAAEVHEAAGRYKQAPEVIQPQSVRTLPLDNSFVWPYYPINFTSQAKKKKEAESKSDAPFPGENVEQE